MVEVAAKNAKVDAGMDAPARKPVRLQQADAASLSRFAFLRAFLRESTICIGLLGIYAWLNHPVLANISSEFFGGALGDPGIYIWLTKHNLTHVLNWPSTGFDSPMFYPFGRTLAYTDNYLLPSLLAMPIFFFTESLALAYNLPLLLAFVLNGYIFYRLVLYLQGSRLLAFALGFAFMCWPNLSYQAGHPQLQYAFFMPAVLLTSFVYCETRRWYYATMLGLLVVAAFLCSAYYAMYCYMLCGLTLMCYGLLRWRTISPLDIAKLAILNVPWVAVLYFLSGPYREVRAAFGPTQDVLLHQFAATLASYIAAPARNLAWADLTHSLGRLEAFLFFGMLNAILAITGLVLLYRNLFRQQISSQQTRITPAYIKYVVLVAVSILLVSQILLSWEMGSSKLHKFFTSIPMWILLSTTLTLLATLGWKSQASNTLSSKERKIVLTTLLLFFLFASFGCIEDPNQTSKHPELAYWLYHYAPGFNALRAVSRAGVIVVALCLCFTGYALHSLLRLELLHTPVRRFAVLILFIALSAYELDMHSYTMHAKHAKPDVYTALEKLPGKEPVVSLPFASHHHFGAIYANLQTQYMLDLQASDRPMLNGYSGKIPLHYHFAGPELSGFPDDRSLAFLGRTVGLRYIVFIPKNNAHFDPRRFRRQLKRNSDQLNLLHKDAAGNYLFEISALVDLNDYPEPLILPADQDRNRMLSFEMMYKSRNAARPALRIKTEVHDGTVIGRETMLHEAKLALEQTNTWLSFRLTVPAARQGVLPQLVQFWLPELARGDKLYLRGVELQ